MYAVIILASLSVIYFLAHQASCVSDVDSSFCIGGLWPIFIVTIFPVTLGGGLFVVAIVERNLYDTRNMIIVGFFMVLIGLVFAGWVVVNID
jgi:hypothetical protein